MASNSVKNMKVFNFSLFFCQTTKFSLSKLHKNHVFPLNLSFFLSPFCFDFSSLSTDHHLEEAKRIEREWKKLTCSNREHCSKKVQFYGYYLTFIIQEVSYFLYFSAFACRQIFSTLLACICLLRMMLRPPQILGADSIYTPSKSLFILKNAFFCKGTDWSFWSSKKLPKILKKRTLFL